GEAADREDRGIVVRSVGELRELVSSRAARRPVGKAHTRIFASGRHAGRTRESARRELLRLSDQDRGRGWRHRSGGRSRLSLDTRLSYQADPKRAGESAEEFQFIRMWFHGETPWFTSGPGRSGFGCTVICRAERMS